MNWLAQTPGEWLVSSIGTFFVIIIATFILGLAIIAYTRLAGLRSFSKMSSFDFAMTLAVGTIFGSTIMRPNPPILEALTALAALFAGQVLVALARRNRNMADLVDNAPVLLMAGTRVLHENLDRCRMTIADLNSKLRQHNVLNRDEIRAVIFETTGDVSVVFSADKHVKLDPTLFEDIVGAEHLAGLPEAGGEAGGETAGQTGVRTAGNRGREYRAPRVMPASAKSQQPTALPPKHGGPRKDALSSPPKQSRRELVIDKRPESEKHTHTEHAAETWVTPVQVPSGEPLPEDTTARLEQLAKESENEPEPATVDPALEAAEEAAAGDLDERKTSDTGEDRAA